MPIIFYTNTNIIPTLNTSKVGFNFIFLNLLNKLTYLFNVIFNIGGNVIFMDFNFNFNYLPVSNDNLFSRSKKNLQKLFNYFNVKVIVYLNLNKKKFTIKNLTRFKLLHISLNNKLISSSFDISLNLSDNYITQYLIYIYILNIYLKIKK